MKKLGLEFPDKMCCGILFNETSRDMTLLFDSTDSETNRNMAYLFEPTENDPSAEPVVIKVASKSGKATDKTTKHPTYRFPKIMNINNGATGILSGTESVIIDHTL